jgi:RNA polymerase sigma factor (sigma-70 family)
VGQGGLEFGKKSLNARRFSQTVSVMDRLLPLVRQLSSDASEPGDTELVDRFAQRNDQDAFGLLVRRHGPMVRGVCRRSLRDDADVDDAFQVTFIILARKAHSLRHPERLAGWLHGVAFRTTNFIRTRAARRHRCERHDSLGMISIEAPIPQTDLGPILDAELSQLAEKYRLPVILCHMQGLSRRQAALRLGCPEGTLSARLARAMAMLRKRLVQRGIAPVAIAGLAGTAETKLARATVEAAVRAVDGSTSKAVSRLAQGVLRMWAVQRISRIGIVVATMAMLAAGIALAPFGASGPAARADQPPATVEKQQPPIRITVGIDSKGNIKSIELREGKDDVVTVNSIATLAKYLKRIRADKSASDSLRVQVRPDAKWATVASLVDACRESGFAKIQLAVDRNATKSAEPKVEGMDERGAITSVAKDNLAGISLGSDHGLKVGHVLHVYRETPTPEYLGALVVQKTESHRSVGKFQPATQKSMIQVGDTVCTKMP